MRTITTTYNVYKFDELSKKAQKIAIEQFREKLYMFVCLEEFYDSFKKIAKAIECDIDYYSYDGMKYYVELIYCGANSNEAEKLIGKRAFAYVMNNFIIPNMQAKHYYKCHGYVQTASRYSKLFSSLNNCPFTGMCADDCFYNTFIEWKNKFNMSTTVNDFLEILSDNMAEMLSNEMEYANRDEYIIEMIEANDYEFLEDGTRY